MAFIIIYELPVSGNYRYLDSLCIRVYFEKYRGQGMTSGHFGGACAPFAHPWIRACLKYINLSLN